MSNKVTELFFLMLGGIAVILYIANLYEWVDYDTYINLSFSLISQEYDACKNYIPIMYLLLALIVLVKISLNSYAMGKAPFAIPSFHPALLLTASTDADNRLISNPSAIQQDENEAIRERHHQQLMQQKQLILECVLEYVHRSLAPYIKTEDLQILCENIKNWESSKDSELLPSITNGQLSTLDLRHIAWNIGERFKWNGEQRATFIKRSFPKEFQDLEIRSIRQNLRQQGTCKIIIDIPEKGDYRFHCSTEST